MTNRQLVALIAGQRDTLLLALDVVMMSMDGFTIPMGKEMLSSETAVERARQILLEAGLDPNDDTQGV